VLTIMSDEVLDSVGLQGPPLDAVRRLAALAVGAGAGALVCSPQEVAAVRSEVGDGVVLITPGVRPAGSDAQDQARVATPEQALADGADLLVIGRPITGAADPGAARSPHRRLSARALAGQPVAPQVSAPLGSRRPPAPADPEVTRVALPPLTPEQRAAPSRRPPPPARPARS
jgi:hypothetical protein